MSPEEFSKILNEKAKEVQKYATVAFPVTSGNIALRFINGNFRAQGFQGSSFKRWKPSTGTILVKSGALRSSFYYTSQPGQITIKNHQPYAWVHNKGHKGTVWVRPHTRNVYGSTKVGTGRFTAKGKERQKTVHFKAGERQVSGHNREMNIEQRQFMPIVPGDAVVLHNAIQREVSKDLLKLFKL